ncbi:MAG: hypothetical protein M3O31_12355 [Acidobacteriota bacterium]|nr:hypothetical protein [Acidobacteriota bacterium]
MKLIYVTGLVACVAAVALQAGLGQTAAQARPWQRKQMPSAAEVERVWQTPPAEYGPNVYYTISGAVDPEVLARDLDTAAKLGFHAVTVQPGRANMVVR